MTYAVGQAPRQDEGRRQTACFRRSSAYNR